MTSQTRNPPASGRVSAPQTELETAEWVGDLSDRKINTVSGEREAEDIEVTEPLLDSPQRGPTAAELVEEEPEASVRVKNSSSKGSPTGSNAKAGSRRPHPSQASFDGASVHPSEKRFPVATRTATPTASSEREEAVTDDEVIVSSRSKSVTQPPAETAERVEQDNARQAEAKARVQVLITQSKSLLKKGEYLPAYRAAQIAERIADSEELFFAAGEEQPADLVRAILRKIRIKESKASNSNPEVGVASVEGNPRIASESLVNAVKPVGQTRSTRPDEWVFSESSSLPEMRIEPGLANRRAAIDRSQFPISRPEWRSSSNEPLTLGSPIDESHEQSTSKSKPLASAENWRTQDLNDVATSRSSLLIAPLPPEEPVVADAVSNALEESFATDIQEPIQPPATSKLGMILAAAAGAFAMLFVRRRPASVYRSGGEGR